MSDCKAYRHEIVEAFDGGALSRGARAHAEACRACGAELRERESLRVLVRGLGKVEAPADFEYRLRARIASSETTGRRARLRGLRFVYAFAPVAAAACFLVVSTALYLRQAATTKQAEAPTARISAPPSSNADAGSVGTTNATGEVNELKQTGELPSEVASAPNIHKVRPAVYRRRAAARPAREVLDGGLRSEMHTVEAARVIKGGGVTITLNSPLRVVLRDESGAGRVVPMRAVSFGSQELIAREGAGRQMRVAENEGVW